MTHRTSKFAARRRLLVSEDDSPVDLEIPEPYQPDWERLEAATNENPFMTAGVELFKEAATLALSALRVSAGCDGGE